MNFQEAASHLCSICGDRAPSTSLLVDAIPGFPSKPAPSEPAAQDSKLASRPKTEPLGSTARSKPPGTLSPAGDLPRIVNGAACCGSGVPEAAVGRHKFRTVVAIIKAEQLTRLGDDRLELRFESSICLMIQRVGWLSARTCKTSRLTRFQS
jgi:hypothetical protein